VVLERLGAAVGGGEGAAGAACGGGEIRSPAGQGRVFRDGEGGGAVWGARRVHKLHILSIRVTQQADPEGGEN
jgi:hypothetical protein